MITLKAVYVVQEGGYKGYTAKDIEDMNDNINATLNGYNFNITEGDYAGYDVQFDLLFVSMQNDDDDGKIIDKAYSYKFEGANIGNTFQRGDARSNGKDFKKKDKGDGSFRVAGGFALDNKHIVMNKGYDTHRRRIHEIWHTFFEDRDDTDYGIMSYNRNDMPNIGDVISIVSKLQERNLIFDKRDFNINTNTGGGKGSNGRGGGSSLNGGSGGGDIHRGGSGGGSGSSSSNNYDQ
jgi:hypothetical protein